MSFVDTFRTAVEAFLVETGMSATALGVAAVKDPNFVGDLRSGRDPRGSTIDAVMTFMTSERARRASSPAAEAAE